jgi:formylglycine-generating enzyme required for sulfatase activity
MALPSQLSLNSYKKPFKLTLACMMLSLALITHAQTSQQQDLSPNNQNTITASETKKKAITYSLPKALHDELLKNMILVEAGTFEMGSDSPFARKREQPVHKVSLDSYYIGKYELTQDIFTEIMGWNNSYFACDKCAVNNISWFNMQLFIERLNLATGKQFSLPTEAQWEFAAKGGNKSKNYQYSGSNNINDVAWFADNANNKSHPVGLKQPNELGLYDMTGNLFEFCLDNMSRHAYSRTESHNPFFGDRSQLKRKAMKVIRGGGYEFSAQENLVFLRDGATNNVRMADIGFRLVLTSN